VCANAAVLDVQDDRWRFTHDKLRETLLSELSVDHARAVHRQIAQAIERMYDPQAYAVSLAYHWGQAGDKVKEADYHAIAGEQTLISGAYREALNYLLKALDIGTHLSVERQAVLEREAGEAYYALGELRQSRIHLERVLTLLGRPLPSARTPGLLQQFAFQLCHRIVHSPRPLQIESVRLTNLALAYERLAQISVLLNDSVTSVYTTLSMVNLTERAGASPELARAYVNTGFVAGVLPQRAWADAYIERGWKTAQQVNNPSATGWVLELRGMYSIGVCRWPQAEESLTRAVELAEQIGDLRKRDEASGLVGVTYYFMGRFIESYERLDTVYNSTVARGDEYLQLTNTLQLVSCSLRLGNDNYLKEAQKHVDKALSLLNESSGVEMEIAAYGLAALVSLKLENRRQARQLADKALWLAQQSRPALCYAMEGYASLPEVYIELYRQTTNEAQRKILERQARAACKAVQTYARVFLHAVPRAWLWQGMYAEHVLGNRADAQKAYTRAQAFARRFSMPYAEALALAAAGQAQPALDLFERLNARADAQRLRATMQRSAERHL
jgi:eukaryotic-like serine/threonine-protein kinase